MFHNSRYGYPAMPSVLDNALAVEAEIDVFEDIERGDIGAAIMDQAAANAFSRGDTFGGFTDEVAADFF